MRRGPMFLLVGLVSCSGRHTNRTPAGWRETQSRDWSAWAPCVLDLPPGAGPTATVWQCQVDGETFFRVETEPLATSVDDARALALLHQRALHRKLAQATHYSEHEVHVASHPALDIEWSASTPVRISSIERELIAGPMIFRLSVSTIGRQLPEDAKEFATLFEVGR